MFLAFFVFVLNVEVILPLISSLKNHLLTVVVLRYFFQELGDQNV